MRLASSLASTAAVPRPEKLGAFAKHLPHEATGTACAVASPGAIPKHLRNLRAKLARLILPPRRARSYPRAVKVKMSSYPRKRPKLRRKAAK